MSVAGPLDLGHDPSLLGEEGSRPQIRDKSSLPEALEARFHTQNAVS